MSCFPKTSARRQTYYILRETEESEPDVSKPDEKQPYEMRELPGDLDGALADSVDATSQNPGELSIQCIWSLTFGLWQSNMLQTLALCGIAALYTLIVQYAGTFFLTTLLKLENSVMINIGLHIFLAPAIIPIAAAIYVCLDNSTKKIEGESIFNYVRRSFPVAFRLLVYFTLIELLAGIGTSLVFQLKFIYSPINSDPSGILGLFVLALLSALIYSLILPRWILVYPLMLVQNHSIPNAMRVSGKFYKPNRKPIWRMVFILQFLSTILFMLPSRLRLLASYLSNSLSDFLGVIEIPLTLIVATFTNAIWMALYASMFLFFSKSALCSEKTL